MNYRFNEELSRPFRLGEVQLENRLVQAPMAGITGSAFRMQARRFGVGLTFTEMVSSYGIHYENRRTTDMMHLHAQEHPVALQLFGDDPQIMAEAAAEAERAGADIIDINMGCSVRKVVKTGAGVALMKDEGRAAEIVAAMVEAVRIPVMAKMRSGFDSVTAPSLAVKLQQAGASAVAIHPRTGAQHWRGRADHNVTAELAGRLQIPVIASGDIENASDVHSLLEETGATAVMLARAALGNPWIFNDLLSGHEPYRRPLEEVLEEMRRFYNDVVGEMGEARAVRYMRKFYGWYLKPFLPGGELRGGLLRAASFDEACTMAREALA